MATIKGIKNRLAAAGRALGGDYTSEKNGSKPKDKLKASQRVNAAQRAMSGDYALRDGKKPVVKVEPAEIRMKPNLEENFSRSIKSIKPPFTLIYAVFISTHYFNALMRQFAFKVQERVFSHSTCEKTLSKIYHNFFYKSIL